MVYFVAKVVPFVAKGGPVLMAKGGILLVAEIGILYLTIYISDLQAIYKLIIRKIKSNKTVRFLPRLIFPFFVS